MNNALNTTAAPKELTRQALILLRRALKDEEAGVCERLLVTYTEVASPLTITSKAAVMWMVNTPDSLQKTIAYLFLRCRHGCCQRDVAIEMRV
jgi:hypothetical protein